MSEEPDIQDGPRWTVHPNGNGYAVHDGEGELGPLLLKRLALARGMATRRNRQYLWGARVFPSMTAIRRRPDAPPADRA